MNRRAATTASFAAIVLCAAKGHAQTASELARRELLTQAEAAATANDHSRAVELLERAGSIQWTPSHRLFIAREYLQVQRVVEALSAATTCEREARADNALRNREAIERACAELAASVRDRVARVVVRVPAERPAGVRVTVAGQSVAEALWGVGFPVNPGSVEVVTEGPGLRTTRARVEAAAGRQTEVSVVIEHDTTATQRTDTTPTNAPRITPDSTDPRPNPSGATITSNPVPPITEAPRPSVAPWVVVGVGGAVALTGAILTGVHFAAVGAIDAECRRSFGAGVATTANGAVACLETGQNFSGQIRDAELLGTLGVTTLVVGGAAVAGGVIWATLSRPRRSMARGVTFAPIVARSSGGFVVGGAF